jgi:predicted nucleotidyltransferase
VAEIDEVEIIGGEPRVPVRELRDRIREYLAGTGVVRGVLFGSFARGDADSVSDVDLMLIEPTTLPVLERGLRHLPLFRLGVGLDLLIYTPEEYERLKREGSSFIESVEREGVTVYSRREG